MIGFKNNNKLNGFIKWFKYEKKIVRTCLNAK